jgi:phytoene dehydrogenase-like protein
MATTERYDAVIVGGGHNGLVAGFYLAKAGLRPLILERREFVGGACVTEEFAPGFRASTGAYVISMLREPVWRDMRLAERGIEIDSAGPSLYGFPGGERLLLGDDIPASQAEIRRHSAADARALP